MKESKGNLGEKKETGFHEDPVLEGRHISTVTYGFKVSQSNSQQEVL